jgi:RND superfamily putative drug exporter
MHRPAAVAVVVAMVLLGVGSVSLTSRFTYYSTAEFPTSLSAVKVEDALSNFSGVSGSPLEAVVTANTSQASEVAAYATALEGVPGVASVEAPAQLSSDLWEVKANLTTSPSSQSALTTVAAVRAIGTPLPVLLTGYTAGFADQEATLVAHLPSAILVLAVTTLLILFVMTGSVVLPFKALVMNGLTMAATLGVLVLVFQDGFLRGLFGFPTQSGIDTTIPVLAGALAFGLSTDYGVFLLSRIREGYVSGHPTRDAVALGLQRVGRVVTSAAALFCIAIGALVLAQSVTLKEVGLAAAVAVLIDASVVRALLVPALMALLGRWNWWAPSWLHSFHQRLGLDRIEAGSEPAAA